MEPSHCINLYDDMLGEKDDQSVQNDSQAAEGLTTKQEAETFFKLVNEPGLEPDACIKLYDVVGEKYDQFAAEVDYTSPQECAQVLAELFPQQDQRAKVQILDVAAGSGLVGVELKKAGFQIMDALDPSQALLKAAEKKNVYRKLFLEYINEKQLPIKKDTYDAVVMVGAMAENHVPSSALHEMIRLVKPGGFIVNIARAMHLNRLLQDELMENLEKDGRWRLVSKTTFPNMAQGLEGMVLIHQVL